MGPAKVALAHYLISTDGKGHVIADTSKPIEQAKWNDANAFVKM
jgi:hypothetical protein